MMRWLVLSVTLFALMGLAQSQDFGNEIGSLDFGSIIGGPMQAVVNAQASAAITTLNFIEAVGFTTDADGVRTAQLVEFLYDQQDATNSSQAFTFAMKVPFLTMVPVPYIEVTDLKIRFNVHLESVATTSREQSDSSSVSLSASVNAIVASTSMKATYSTSTTTKATGSEKRRYSLEVEVLARGAGLPSGTSRILELFEEVIQRGIPRGVAAT